MKHLHKGASLMETMSAMWLFTINLCLLIVYIFSVKVFHLWDCFEMMRLWLYGSLLMISGQLVLFFIYKRFAGAIGYIASMILILKVVLPSGILGYASNISIGSSNQPTLKENDLIIAKNFDLKYDRGVMVAVNIKGKRFIKRIHGVPNDQITICDGEVFVNNYTYQYVNKWVGAEFDSPLLCKREYRKIVLSEGEFFVLGDNLSNSFDSRNFGPVQKSAITMNYLFVFRGNELRNTISLTSYFTQPEP